MQLVENDDASYENPLLSNEIFTLCNVNYSSKINIIN